MEPGPRISGTGHYPTHDDIDEDIEGESISDGFLCSHADFCGGCAFKGVSYEAAFRSKEKAFLDLLRAHKIEARQMDSMEMCPPAWRYRYRNKMEYTFGDLEKGGELTLGMHKRGCFMSVGTVEECLLVDHDFNALLRFTLQFCREKAYEKYNKKTHQGLLRNLLIRKGVRTRELLICLVTSSDGSFDDQAWQKGLLSLPLRNTIVGILHAYNDTKADAVKPESVELLYGRNYYWEEIGGLSFAVDLFSFFQTNVPMAEGMYSEALALLGEKKQRIFDLYCGTGTLTQLAASKADEVIGVEWVDASAQAARANARKNGIKNVRFICGDVYEVLHSIEEKPDCIIVDPPRIGLGPKAAETILAYGVETILYISCNPKSLVSDLAIFHRGAYEIRYIKPFDNFPWTRHVECIALIQRVKS